VKISFQEIFGRVARFLGVCAASGASHPQNLLILVGIAAHP
jgi:hypothetical protein